MTPRPPINFQVSQSQQVTEQFLALAALAQIQGRRAAVFRACLYIMDELAYDPLHFGESREELVDLQLKMRIAFAPPIYVQFAVHEQSRQVFIRKFGMRS